MGWDEIKEEIKLYVKALETGYLYKIEDYRKKQEKEKRLRIVHESVRIN